MLFWALLASGQINMRKVDGWQTLATKLIDQPRPHSSVSVRKEQ
jgi:putative transposase